MWKGYNENKNCIGKKKEEKDTRKPSEHFDGWGYCFHAAGRPKWLIPRNY